MLHTVEQLIHRINVMNNKAIELHRVRNSEQYNQAYAQELLDDIQSMALLIARDREGTEIKTEMDK